jgi:O-antigen/teichoic acid export membrane protein
MRHSVARNAGLLGAAAIGSRGLSFLLALFLARGLGPHDYGLYALAAAVVTLMNQVGDVGLSPYVTRGVARDRAALDAELHRLLAIRGTLVLAGAAAVVAWLVASDGSELARTVAITYLALTLESVAYLGFAYLQGLERMSFEAGTTLLAAAVRTGGGVALIVLGAGLETVLWWMAVVSLVQALAVAARLRSEEAGRGAPARAARPGLAAILASGGAMMLVGIANAVVLRADSIVIGAFEGAREVGLYTAAYALVTGAVMLPWMVSVAVFPRLSSTFRRDRRAFERAWERSGRLTLLLGLPAALLATILAGPIVERIYGDGYAPSAEVLAILVWWIPLVTLSALCAALLRAADREWTLAGLVGAGAILNVTANLVVVPAHGMVGASLVTVSIEALVMVALWWTVHRLGAPRPPLHPLARALPAAAGLVVVALVLRPAPVEIGIVAAAAAYALLLVLFRAVSPRELRLARRAALPAPR